MGEDILAKTLFIVKPSYSPTQKVYRNLLPIDALDVLEILRTLFGVKNAKLQLKPLVIMIIITKGRHLKSVFLYLLILQTTFNEGLM